MLNGAYTIVTPDCVSHLAEEISQPRQNIPLAIGSQMIFGFVWAFIYNVAILYAITDLDKITNSRGFPLARIYAQATASNAGTIELLCFMFVPIFYCCIGSYITPSRCLWTIARDDAVPFSETLKMVSPRFKNPFNAALVCGVLPRFLRLLRLGQQQPSMPSLVHSSFYPHCHTFTPILGFILTRRFSRPTDVPGPYTNCMMPGPYQMGSKLGYTVNILSCLFILIFVVYTAFHTVCLSKHQVWTIQLQLRALWLWVLVYSGWPKEGNMLAQEQWPMNHVHPLMLVSWSPGQLSLNMRQLEGMRIGVLY